MNYLITGTKLDLNSPEVDIVINGGLITEIGSNLKGRSEYATFEIIDGRGSVALSGLVDLHTQIGRAHV